MSTSNNVCSALQACNTCTSNSNCVWCNTDQKCLPGNFMGATTDLKCSDGSTLWNTCTVTIAQGWIAFAVLLVLACLAFGLCMLRRYWRKRRARRIAERAQFGRQVGDLHIVRQMHGRGAATETLAEKFQKLGRI